jgi:hypothetical protein
MPPPTFKPFLNISLIFNIPTHRMLEVKLAMGEGDMTRNLFGCFGLLAMIHTATIASSTTDEVIVQENRTTSFTDLPIDLQAIILGDQPDEYHSRVLSFRGAKRAMERSWHCMVARPNSVLVRFVEDALDAEKQLVPSSELVQFLRGPAQNIMIKRLLEVSGSDIGEPSKDLIRTLLTRHVVDNIFHTKDVMIEVSRKSVPKTSKSLIHMARGNTAHGLPMVHSHQMPYAFQERLDEAQLVEAISTADGTFRTWRLPDGNNPVVMMSTVSKNGSEEYVIHNPVYLNGRVKTEFVRVLDHDSEIKDWPLGE